MSDLCFARFERNFRPSDAFLEMMAWRPLLVVAVALVAGLSSPSHALANPGALDATFGTRGVSYLPVPQASYRAPVEAPTGELYALGVQQTSFGLCGVGGGNSCNSFASFVVGVTRSGQIRRRFGTGGVFDLSFSATAMAVAPNGNVLIAGVPPGQRSDASAAGAEVLELTPNGSTASGFGTDGLAHLSGPAGVIEAIKVLSDGDAIVTGQSSQGAFFAERLTSAGAVDPSFGEDGVLTQQFGSGAEPSSEATDVIVNRSGDLVFAVSASAGSESLPAGFQLEEFTQDGGPDSTFTSSAFEGVPNVVRLYTATQAVVQSGQGYVVTGVATGPTYQDVPVAARFTPQGMVDSSFGHHGVFVGAPVGTVSSAIARANGVLDLVWSGQLPGKNAVIQLQPNGRPDDSFGPNGIATQPLPSYGTSGGVLDAAGNLIVLGRGGSKGSYLARVQLQAGVPSLIRAHIRHARLFLVLSCRGSSETDCTTHVTLTTKSRRTIARKTVTIGGGRRLRLTLRLGRRQQQLLLRSHRRLIATLRTGKLRTVKTITIP